MSLNFQFVGCLESSKSMMNRALIIQSYQPGLLLNGASTANDVVDQKRALGELFSLSSPPRIHCGEAGTVFRFMVLRASRLQGEFEIGGSQRLLERPHEELIQILGQLGVEVQKHRDHWHIRSQGWRLCGDSVHVGVQRSSQFISSLMLNAWDLPFDLYIKLDGVPVSEGYFEMTLHMLQQAGMNFKRNKSEIFIGKGQKPLATELVVEPDMSSVFAISSCAVINGNIRIKGIPQKSLQPDFQFIEIFKKMGIKIEHEGDILSVQKTDQFNGVDIDLTGAPDLFPVLAALLSQAKTKSILRGARQLAFKESNRRVKVHELLEQCGYKVHSLEEAFEIDPLRFSEKPLKSSSHETKPFHPDHDHRMAFAAGLLKLAGHSLAILQPQVVEKSFPDFWSIIGVKP